MRVATAFKRLLRLPGASVVDVCFGAEGIVATVRLCRRRRVGAPRRDGRQPENHDRRRKRWRDLDLGEPARDRARAAPAALPTATWSAGAGAVGAARLARHA